jgi:hypothetical protein
VPPETESFETVPPESTVASPPLPPLTLVPPAPTGRVVSEWQPTGPMQSSTTSTPFTILDEKSNVLLRTANFGKLEALIRQRPTNTEDDFVAEAPMA